MRKGKIEFEGKTYSDVEMAIDEAKKKILRELKIKSSGITSGFDRIGDGNYSFEIGDKKLFVKDIAKPKEGKDEGWIKELADETQKFMKWMKEHPFTNLQKRTESIRAILVLIKAVTNLDKRVSELEKSEEVRELIKRGG